ncbi:hypothetical protein [Sagittula sp. MA-2]|jgi:hypothetical protein|uniref:hypothetical protein n=1 Tax=Sagittula sp. MA-2 TaxID=3048007 RepID=UPI0024C33A9F|nr:hypothetical protein [Sagittula sp. MA-2]WHZ35743.1 hypothetical protein QNI11_01765 [Sagittula sp. MA-2]
MTYDTLHTLSHRGLTRGTGIVHRYGRTYTYLEYDPMSGTHYGRDHSSEWIALTDTPDWRIAE